MADAPLAGESAAPDAERLAEALDAFRERLIALDMPTEVIDAWLTAATAMWDAVAVLEEAENG